MAYLTPTPTLIDATQMLRYMGGLLGIPHKDIVDAIHRRGPLGPGDTQNLLKDVYGFSSPDVADIAFRQAGSVAKDTIDKLINTLGMDPNQFGQKTEQQTNKSSIAEELKYLNPRIDKTGEHGYKQGVSKKSMFEAKRKLFLMDIALRLIKQVIIEDPGNTLDDIQDYFDRTLFKGPVGSDELRIHHLRIDKTGKVAKKGKMVTFMNRMRPIYLNGEKIFVQTDFGEKSYPSQILKLLCDFAPKVTDMGKMSYGEFDPIGLKDNGELHIHDRSRFRFVLENRTNIEALSNLVMRMKGDDDTPVFTDITESPLKHDRGQAKTWEKRFKAWHNGAPVEILFFDVDGHYNATNQYGKIDESNKLYDGADHKLYEIRRLLKILEFLFPYEIYKKNEVQTHEQYSQQLLKYAQRMSKRVAEDLMASDED